MQLSWSIPYLPGPNRITPMQICELWRKLGCQPMVMASNGLFLILSNLEIMRSMGVRTNLQGNGNSGLLKVRLLCRPCLFASCEKVIAPNPSRKQMKTVCASFQSAAAQAKCTCHGAQRGKQICESMRWKNGSNWDVEWFGLTNAHCLAHDACACVHIPSQYLHTSNWIRRSIVNFRWVSDPNTASVLPRSV